MFEKKSFISHAGNPLNWKIECDPVATMKHGALGFGDLETLAFLIAQKIRFGKVYGIPRGGRPLAGVLRRHVTEGPRLIVDDVCTTGRSFQQVYQPGDIGVVIFAHGPVPDWVTPIFSLHEMFRDV